MATQVLDNFENQSSKVFMLRDILPGPAWAPPMAKSPARAEETVRVSESSAEDGSCVKGMILAFGLEASGALIVYGLWQFWLSFR